MHYFIDGYNFLFRLASSNENLQLDRQALIYELDKKISLVQFNVSLIFDGTYQDKSDRDRFHFNALEILFTAHGETADDYILQELSEMRFPKQQVVITSDKRLAWKVRYLGAQTESVESFAKRLNRQYKNKCLPKKTKDKPLSPSLPKNLPVEEQIEYPLSNSDLSDYYLEAFENEWIEINEQIEKNKLLKKNKQKPKRKPKPPLSFFPQPLSKHVEASTEQERWLKSFEEGDYPPYFPKI